jgi:hypothetical protein
MTAVEELMTRKLSSGYEAHWRGWRRGKETIGMQRPVAKREDLPQSSQESQKTLKTFIFDLLIYCFSRSYFSETRKCKNPM